MLSSVGEFDLQIRPAGDIVYDEVNTYSLEEVVDAQNELTGLVDNGFDNVVCVYTSLPSNPLYNAFIINCAADRTSIGYEQAGNQVFDNNLEFIVSGEQRVDRVLISYSKKARLDNNVLVVDNNQSVSR